MANAHYKDSAALRWAAGNGHVECLKLLIPVATNAAHNTIALRWSVLYAQLECINLLIPISEMHLSRDNVLATAAFHGNIHALQKLIPFSDPQANHSEALVVAVLRHHDACVDILLPISNVKDAVKKLNLPNKDYLLQVHKNLQQKNMLEQTVGLHTSKSTARSTSSVRKM